MLTEVARRGVKSSLCQFVYPTRLKPPQVLTQGVIADTGESANLLVLKALTFQPQDVHPLSNPGMGMIVA